MYRTCIHCSSDLGGNEAIESFPVGRGLAFDQWKGRLWVVCPRCARWNLSPLEERWEAVEEAEKRFVDARLRVQSENVGLARLPDGTRLIRVGRALPGELAAWRYGEQLVRRRRRYLWGTAGAVGIGAVAVGGLWAGGAIVAASHLFNLGSMVWQSRQSRRPVWRLRPEDSPTGEELLLHRFQLHGARVVHDSADGLLLRLPEGRVPPAHLAREPEAWELVLRGEAAQVVLRRAMTTANYRGASDRSVQAAVRLLADAGSPESLMGRVGEREASIGIPRLQYMGRHLRLPGPGLRTRARQVLGTFRGEIMPYQKLGADEALSPGRSHPYVRRLMREEKQNRLPATQALALEMALHEQTERRALEGELAALEAAWREAEEIAAIADVLPEDPLRRLLHR